MRMRGAGMHMRGARMHMRGARVCTWMARTRMLHMLVAQRHLHMHVHMHMRGDM